MDRDPDIVVMGEDVGYFGGVFETLPWHLEEQRRQMLDEAGAAGIETT